MMSSSDCSVKVVCRVRPLNEKEKDTSSFVVNFPAENCVGVGNRMFTYDRVFPPNSSQEDVYLSSAKPLVQDVLSGYNATIFAYGQTSSGKTYTMEGDLESEHMQGIIPRIVVDMFDQLYNMDVNVEVHIKVSYFEIYMEKIRDLLDVTKVNLPIGETKSRVPYVKGVTERFVTTPEEVFEAIEEGKSNRQVAITNMNAHSSRSHAVFLLSVKLENKDTRKTIFGKLYLVDLAGSEKVDKTNAMGLTLEEAKTINKSLLALSNVIAALSSSDSNKQGFIPYRDSKLTRVLQESLGGNARTTLVICCSPSSFNEPETKTTLLFGDRAKSIKNKVEMNVELTADEWRRRYDRLKETNSRLRATVDMYESELSLWRAGKDVPEEDQRRFGSRDTSMDSLKSTPYSSPQHTPTKSFSPTPPDFLHEERIKLNQIIDEKDGMIQSQAELIKKLTQQLRSLEEEHKSCREECHTLKQQMAQVSVDLATSQADLKEVLQALEELAVSYDCKDKEIQQSLTAKLVLQEEVDKLQQSVDSKSRELHILQDSTLSEKRKNQERLSTLLRDLNDVGVILGTKMEDKLRQLDAASEFTDEDFTKARIHLSNMRCEVRTLSKQREVLEIAEKEARDRAHSAVAELSSCKAKITEYESQNETLISSLQEVEVHKETLEQTLMGLKRELEDLRSREKALLLSAREEAEGSVRECASEMKQAMEEEMQEREAKHAVKIQKLQAEIVDKEAEITNITKQHKKQLVVMDNLIQELEDMQKRYSEEKQEFLRMQVQTKVKEKIQQDLGGLTDTVSREMERLNGLREQYMQHMSSRLKSKSLDEDTLLQARTQKEFQFLERNLEELDRAHKKAISEKAEMSREIPRLRGILASKSKRIGQLEHMIGETKEAANAEYEKLRAELDQMKQNFIAKLKEKERESQYGSSQPRYRHSISYTDQLTGLSHTHNSAYISTDPLTGLVQPAQGHSHPSTKRRSVDTVTGLSVAEPAGRTTKRLGTGPTFVRPVGRRSSTDSIGSTSRERLMAEAGVALIGQRPKPSQLSTIDDSEPPLSGSRRSGLSSRR